MSNLNANHTLSPNFFRGGIGPKWKFGRKIFCAPPARKKRGSQIFRLRRAFFVVEALKTAKKPLKTAKNRKIFLKTSIFWKKWPQNFFACAGLFFRKIGRTILQIWSDKRGGVKNILYPPLDNVWLQDVAPTHPTNQFIIKNRPFEN